MLRDFLHFEFLEEIAVENMAYFLKQLGVDALFPENLIDIGSVAMKFIGKPCDGSLLLAQFLLYQASDMDHLLARIIVMTHNKKDVGVHSSAPIPESRPSHCPHTRISNASQPTSSDIIKPILNYRKVMCWLGYNTPTRTLLLHYLCVWFQVCEV